MPPVALVDMLYILQKKTFDYPQLSEMSNVLCVSLETEKATTRLRVLKVLIIAKHLDPCEALAVGKTLPNSPSFIPSQKALFRISAC